MTGFEGKKLLVLSGNDIHKKIVKAAQNLGVYTIVTDYLPPELSPAKLVADEFWMISTGETDALVKKCREEKVDGVLSYCIDTIQFHYLALCERLGVPCYGTKKQFEIMTNKRSFKDYCKSHGVGTIPEYSLDDIDNECVLYPILVKPTDSRGSRGQTLCYSTNDVLPAVSFAKRESKDGGFLIERYMLGAQDMSFVYFVINGEPYLVKIGDRYLGNIKDRLEKQQMATVLPSRFAEKYRKQVEPNIIRMIKSLGIEFGPVYMQGFYDNGEIYMYDPGLRFPGSDFDIVLRDATGFDCMTSCVKFALTGDVASVQGNPEDVYNYGGKVCGILSISVREGKIGTISGMDRIVAYPGVLSANFWHHEGDVILSTGDVRQRVVEFCCKCTNRNSLNAFVKFVYDNLTINDEFGKDMIVSRVNFS